MSESVSPVAPLDSGPSAGAGDAFAAARALMVDGQVRPNQVNDARIIQAMRAVRRERFVPAAAQGLAYRDGDVALGQGRFLTEPRVIARLLQAARVRAGERVLVVAAGTGYAAVLLAWLGAEVVALESDAALAAHGAALTADADAAGGWAGAPAIRWRQGALGAGAPQDAPFDVILVDGAVSQIPPALGSQLRAGGRLLAVIGKPGQVAYAALAEASPSGLRPVPLFDAATRPLQELAVAPAFVF